MSHLTIHAEKPADATCEVLRSQLNEARAAYDHERNEKTIDDFSKALKRFIDFLCSGIVPADMKHENPESTIPAIW